MADFLSRLVQRGLGLADADVVRPLIAPLFAAGTDPSWDDGLDLTDDVDVPARPADQVVQPLDAQPVTASSQASPQLTPATGSPLTESRRHPARPDGDGPPARAERSASRAAPGPAAEAPRPPQATVDVVASRGRAPSDAAPAAEPPPHRPASAVVSADAPIRPAPLVPVRRETAGRDDRQDVAREAHRPPATPPEPIVRVSIGRVEVRAVFPAPAPPSVKRRSGPRLTLEEYVKQRAEGRR